MSDISSLFERTKHPLIVLSFSTIIGSILIPYVGAKIAKDNRRADQRSSNAVEALHSSSETDRQLNLLITEFGNFVKDEEVTDPAARSALRGRIYSRYAEFNKSGWWWHWQLLQEVEVLQLVDPDEATAMRAAVKAYASNLENETAAIDPHWNVLLSSDSHPEPGEVDALFKETYKRSGHLQEERASIVVQMLSPLHN